MNLKQIEQRVISAAEQVLLHEQYVSPLDLMIDMKWLQPVHVQAWRKGKIPFLEDVIQANLSQISCAMKCFRHWAAEQGLKPSQTAYLARTRGAKRALRFSISGNPQIETAYRTHYISRLLSEKKQQKLNRPSGPEVIFQKTFLSTRRSKTEEPEALNAGLSDAKINW